MDIVSYTQVKYSVASHETVVGGLVHLLAPLLRLGDRLRLDALRLDLCHHLALLRSELLLGHATALHLLQAGAVLKILLVRAEETVAPAEGGREVVHEGHVVEVVVLRARPEGEPVLERPREVCEVQLK